MAVFYSQNGITHQFTGPYTSAYNGHAKCLLHALLEKAWMMRIVCNVPPSMWDKSVPHFLINLSTSSSLHGRTPYEYWFNQLLSLSHLHEIGCQAYALIYFHLHNPKLLPHSIPCIMISYGLTQRHTDSRSTNRIFNSFHITFIEHLDSLPVMAALGCSRSGVLEPRSGCQGI